MFTDHTDLMSFLKNSALKPLFNLKNSIIYYTVCADVRNEFSSILPEHLVMPKCAEFYEKFVYLLQSRKSIIFKLTLWHTVTLPFGKM